MLSITSGRIAKPQKVVIYGPEGIGKTTLASHFPDPVFIDTEGSTYHMDMKRTPKPQSWQELLSQVEQISGTPGICKTLPFSLRLCESSPIWSGSGSTCAMWKA